MNSRRRHKVAEKYVQGAILEYLQASRIYALRMNTGVQIIEEPGKKSRRVAFGVPGMADILAFPIIADRPHPLWIECKASKDGRQSEHQKSFQLQVEAADHTYLLANDLQIVIDWLKSYNVF